MIAAAGAPDIFQNALFDAVGSLFVVALTGSLPFARRGYRQWRDERLFLRGRRASPGVEAVAPAGARMAAVEAILDEHTVTLGEQDRKLDFIVRELSPNSGSSMKDQVNKLTREVASLKVDAAKGDEAK